MSVKLLIAAVHTTAQKEHHVKFRALLEHSIQTQMVKAFMTVPCVLLESTAKKNPFMKLETAVQVFTVQPT